jgi:hypothetical protein
LLDCQRIFFPNVDNTPPFLNLCLKSWNQLHYMVL